MIHAIVAAYGTTHLPFLGAWLEQIATLFSETVAPRVLFAELGEAAARRWRAAYPWVEWVSGHGPGTDARQVRVARKLDAWVMALNAAPAIARGDRLVCMDVDTLILRDPAAAWIAPPGQMDFGYTVRPGRWPLNSGVIFGTMSPLFVAELAAWARETEHWLSSPAKVQQAIDAHGAPDQAALAVCLSKMEDGGGLAVRKLRAEVWNHDWCPAGGTLGDIGILHLKGCLPLLLETRAYGPDHGDERRPADCEPAFALWRGRWQTSARRLRDIAPAVGEGEKLPW